MERRRREPGAERATRDAKAAQLAVIAAALRRIVQALRTTAQAAERRHSISAAQLFVLHLLEESGPASISELAERSFTHSSSVSVVVARLAEAGLVARERASDDRRRTDVAITRRGRSLLRRVPEPAQAQLFAALGRMSATERRSLARGLETLVRTMGIPEGPPAMFFEEGPPRKRKRVTRRRAPGRSGA